MTQAEKYRQGCGTETHPCSLIQVSGERCRQEIMTSTAAQFWFRPLPTAQFTSKLNPFIGFPKTSGVVQVILCPPTYLSNSGSRPFPATDAPSNCTTKSRTSEPTHTRIARKNV